METMYQVLFTQDEYDSLVQEFSDNEIMTLGEFNSIDREKAEHWENLRIDYNTLVALRRATQVEIEIDLYEH